MYTSTNGLECLSWNNHERRVYGLDDLILRSRLRNAAAGRTVTLHADTVWVHRAGLRPFRLYHRQCRRKT